MSIGDDIAQQKVTQLYLFNNTLVVNYDQSQPKTGKKYIDINIDQFYKKKKAIAKEAKKDPVYSELFTGKKDF